MIDDDVTRASTLPATFYRDPAIFEQLRERVIARSWQLVDAIETVREPGAVRPFSFLPGCVEEPLVLARDAGGTLRCLSNVCTHRGNLVCTEPGVVRALQCRYHGRKFGLDGRFASMPAFEEAKGFPSARDHLPEVALARLGPLAFAAIDPRMPFEELALPVRARMAFLDLDRLVADPDGDRAYDVAAHFVLYLDNYLEGFHVPYVHPGLAREIEYGTYRTELDPWGTTQIAEARDPKDAFEGTKDAAYYFFLFPNVLLNFYPWGLSANVVVPLAIDRTRVLYRTWVLEPEKRGRGAGGALDAVEREDGAIVEQVQRGIRSRLYDRGRYSPSREAGVHHVHRLLARALA